MPVIEALLTEVDAAWQLPGPKIRLRIVGSTALMLQTSHARGTKDSDVLETDEVTENVARHLIEIAGPDTEIHKRRGVYIDIVRRGVQFRRQAPVYHHLSNLSAALQHFEVEVMSVSDVIVGKLARFNANDRNDIDAMVEGEFVAHDEIVSCFREAVDFKMDMTSEEFARFVKNLNAMERDMFAVPETEIDEPSWLR